MYTLLNPSQFLFIRFRFCVPLILCTQILLITNFLVCADPIGEPVHVECRLIPAWADLVYISTHHGEQDGTGIVPAEIYVTGSESTQIQRLTFSRFAYLHAAVSPDRTLIAAGRIIGDTNKNGAYELSDVKRVCIINPSTNQQIDYATEYDATWGGLDWSPDGHFLYASMTHDYLTWDIYRIQISDGSIMSLTDGLNAQLGVPGIRHWVSDISVSHDGKWLAGIFAQPEDTGFFKKMRVFEIRSDGTSARILTDGGELVPGQYGLFPAGDFDPEFSPDLLKVVFARVTGVGYNGPLATSDIVTVSRDDLAIENFSGEGNPASHGIPDWNYDGRLVFTEWRVSDPLYSGPVILSAPGQKTIRYWPAVGGTHAKWIPLGQSSSLFWFLY